MLSLDQITDLNRRAKLTCFGSCLIHLILGSFYSWGNLNVYVVSYYKSMRPNDYDFLTVDTTAFIFPFMGFLIFLTTPIGVKICSMVRFSLSCSFFSVLISISLFLAAFSEDFWLFMLFYAVIPGCLMGILSSASIYVVLKYKIAKNYVNGLMMLFYGIGTALANFIAFLTINPLNDRGIKLSNDDDDLYFPEDISDQLPHFLRILAIFYLVIGLLGSSLLKLPEFDGFVEDDRLIPGDREEDQFDFVYSIAEKENDDMKKYYRGLQETVEQSRFYNLKSVLKSWKFYQLSLIIILSSPFGFFSINYYKIIGFLRTNDDLCFVVIGSFAGLVNGFSRFVVSLISRKVGFRLITVIILVIQLAIIATLDIIADNLALFGTWMALALLCQGGIYGIFPKITYQTFGKGLYPQSFTFMLFAFVLGNLLHYGLTSVFLDMAGLANLMWTYFAFTLVALLLALFFKEEEKVV